MTRMPAAQASAAAIEASHRWSQQRCWGRGQPLADHDERPLAAHQVGRRCRFVQSQDHDSLSGGSTAADHGLHRRDEQPESAESAASS